jgi:glycosyltransferase involved in cell wall biosynthesis
VDINEIETAPITKDLKKEFPQFTFILFMASRLTKEKRIDVALYALQKIVLKFPRIGLVIAGDGGEKRNLENLVRNLGLTNNVVFIGWQDNLVSLYKTANMFLVTSDYEGYGMTIIEASAAGCPVVMTKVGIAEDLIVQGQNDFICSVGDVDCLVGKIVGFISDNSKRELFKQSVRDSIMSMIISRDEYVSRYLSAIESLL